MNIPKAFMYRRTMKALVCLSRGRTLVRLFRKDAAIALSKGDFARVHQCNRYVRDLRIENAELLSEILRGDYASH